MMSRISCSERTSAYALPRLSKPAGCQNQQVVTKGKLTLQDGTSVQKYKNIWVRPVVSNLTLVPKEWACELRDAPLANSTLLSFAGTTVEPNRQANGLPSKSSAGFMEG